MTPTPNEQLCDAASRGDLDAVKEALAQGASLKAKGYADMTALTLAARDGQTHVVQFLLEQGAEVTSDALLVANMSADSTPHILGMLQLAQLRQVQPKTKGHAKADAQLLWAAYQGDLQSLQEAIQAGANVNVSDDQDNAALRWAARGGHVKVVRALLDAGADVNQRSYTKWTALIEAVMAGSEETVALLIERGADVSAKTFADASVLYFARDLVREGFAPDPAAARRIIQLLEEHGAEYSEPAEDDD